MIIMIVIPRGVDMAEFLVADPAIQDAHPHTQYDLIANICHEGEPGKGRLTHFGLSRFVAHKACLQPSPSPQGRGAAVHRL